MTIYVNSATGCSAQIEKIDSARWQLIATDGEGRSETSEHPTEDSAKRAMYAFRSGWCELPAASSPSHRRRSVRDLAAEEAVALFLEHRGYRIVEREWACPYGDVDIIAEHDGTVAFIEVNVSANKHVPFPRAELRERRERFERVAAAYANGGHLGCVVVRADVASVCLLGDNRCIIQHHIGAYSKE